MNEPLPCEGTATPSPRFARLWHLGLAAVLSFLCLGIVLLASSAKDESGNNFGMPTGQLQADERTLAAALHYLIEPEPDYELDSAAFSGRAADFTRQTLNRPFATFACSSNQAEMLPEPSTNRPARS